MAANNQSGDPIIFSAYNLKSHLELNDYSVKETDKDKGYFDLRKTKTEEIYCIGKSDTSPNIVINYFEKANEKSNALDEESIISYIQGKNENC